MFTPSARSDCPVCPLCRFSKEKPDKADTDKTAIRTKRTETGRNPDIKRTSLPPPHFPRFPEKPRNGEFLENPKTETRPRERYPLPLGDLNHVDRIR